MSNLVERQKEIENEIFNLSKSYFKGKVNRARDRRLSDLRKQLSDINRITYSYKKKR